MPDEKALKEELQALETALRTEEDGYHYFKEASERAGFPLAQKFFATLANDEWGHINMIKDFYGSLKQNPNKAISLPIAPADYKTRVKTIFAEARKEIKGKVTQDTSILDVYRTAMDLETKASSFYKTRAEKTKFEQARKMYEWLFLFESDHYRMLSETLSYLESTEHWYLETERAIFEG
jgi:rubrerythrin